MVMEKQSGMATRHTSAKSHGSAGKLGAVNDAASGAAEAGNAYKKSGVRHVCSHWHRTCKRVPNAKRVERLLLLTGRHFRHVHDFWHDGPRQRLELRWVNVHVRHGLKR